MDNMGHNVVVFDGICNLCNRAVNFIIKRDSDKQYRFTSFQSDAGRKLSAEHGISKIDSIILIKEGKCIVKSNAVLGIVKDFGGVWPVLAVFRILPLTFRDGIYNVIAKNRYRLFGKRQQCRIPVENDRERFIIQ